VRHGGSRCFRGDRKARSHGSHEPNPTRSGGTRCQRYRDIETSTRRHVDTSRRRDIVRGTWCADPLTERQEKPQAPHREADHRGAFARAEQMRHVEYRPVPSDSEDQRSDLAQSMFVPPLCDDEIGVPGMILRGVGLDDEAERRVVGPEMREDRGHGGGRAWVVGLLDQEERVRWGGPFGEAVAGRGRGRVSGTGTQVRRRLSYRAMDIVWRRRR
jgi:hypothetical protein